MSVCFRVVDLGDSSSEFEKFLVSIILERAYKRPIPFAVTACSLSAGVRSVSVGYSVILGLRVCTFVSWV